jgi:RNA polymerase sigma factor, sigma-70 family
MEQRELETLILQNEKLIYSIMKYFYKYPNKDDLFQAGCIGLIEAYYRYKNDMNTKFSTYAYGYILGEMKKLVREDKGIKISRNISSLYLKIEKASILLSQRFMREPTPLEISSFLEIEEKLVVEAMNSTNILLDVDEISVGINDDNNIYLKEELSKLSSEELDIISNRYMEDRTQSETAILMGISQVQVSRKEQKALEKLKKRLVA